MGESGEGQNITHQQKKMTEEALLAFRDRFDLPITDEQVAEAPFYKPPDDGPEMSYLHERRAALGGFLPARRRRRRQSLPVPQLEIFETLLEGTGEREISTTMAFVRVLASLLRDKKHRQARRADRPRRVAHLRHGGDVPPARDLLPGRPALRARGRRAAHVLPRGQEGPDPPGGHQRGRRDVVLDRRRHRVLEPRRADDPVLRLLLDVRLPAHRRPGLGRRRLARARLPDGRHRRAHDAQRRGPPARGRPQPPLRLDDPELRRLRPGLRLRARGDRPGRPAPHARRQGGRLLLHDDHERELRAAGDARGRRGGHPARHVPRARGRRATRRACSCSAPARSCARSSPRPICCAEDFGVPPTSGARPASPSCAATASTPSAGTALHPAEPSAACLRRAAARRARRARSSRRRTT